MRGLRLFFGDTDMMRALYIPAITASQAEDFYLRVRRNVLTAPVSYHSEHECRAGVATYPRALRENTRIWCVTERFGPDGPIVVAEDITARPENVIGLTGRRPL